MERESFIFYASFYQAIKEIPNENQLKVYQAITNFALTGQEPTDLNGIEKAVFILVKPQIIANNKRYENGCGGGRPKKEEKKNKKTNGFKNKKPKHNQSITKVKPNENVNENDNDNVNDNVNENENDKQIEQPKQPVAPASKKKSPQAVMCDYFKGKYKANTGLEYLTNNEDFVILADLIKKYGMEQVKQRIDWLETSCLNAVFWFAKSINDFTIGNLRKHWNKILKPITEEQRRQEQEKKKEEERMKRVLAEVQRRKEEEAKWNTQ